MPISLARPASRSAVSGRHHIKTCTPYSGEVILTGLVLGIGTVVGVGNGVSVGAVFFRVPAGVGVAELRVTVLFADPVGGMSVAADWASTTRVGVVASPETQARFFNAS